jgi:hypothetical protein
MHLELNFNWSEIQFDNWIKIQLKKSEMQIDEKISKITHEYVVEKKL